MLMIIYSEYISSDGQWPAAIDRKCGAKSIEGFGFIRERERVVCGAVGYLQFNQTWGGVRQFPIIYFINNNLIFKWCRRSV